MMMLFLGIVSALVSDPETLTEKRSSAPIVFIVRARANSNGEGKLEYKSEIFTAQRFQKILGRLSPETEFRTIEVSDLRELSLSINSHLDRKRAFQGLILQGHGGADAFYMPRLVGGDSQEKWRLSGQQIARHILNVAEANTMANTAFVYTNSCANFYRESDKDGGLDSELIQGLVGLTAGDKPKLENFVLIGHLGMAGFYEWRRAWLTDRIFKALKTELEVIGWGGAKSQFQEIGVRSALVAYALGLVSIPLLEGAHASSWALLAGVPLATIESVRNLLRLNYIAVQGRAIILARGEVFHDKDLIIRKGLTLAATTSACRSALSRLMRKT